MGGKGTIKDSWVLPQGEGGGKLEDLGRKKLEDSGEKEMSKALRWVACGRINLPGYQWERGGGWRWQGQRVEVKVFPSFIWIAQTNGREVQLCE